MNSPVSSIAKTKIGCCPHGLPAGACPICSGMGGGGGGSKKLEKPSGEMSWDECVAMGQILKAQRLAQQQRNLAMQGQMPQAPLSIADKLGNVAQKIANLSEKLAKIIDKSQSTPALMAKIAAVMAKLAIPVLNILKTIPTLAQKTLNFVTQKFADISDKLNAIFGELKSSIEKKISDRFKNFKKKTKSIFEIFEPLDEDNEEKRVEENKRFFELKTVLTNIKETLTKKEKKELTNGSS